MPSFLLRLRVAAFFSVVAASPVWALDEPTSFILDLPFSANAATPTWLGHPAAPTTTFATLNVPVQPSSPDASLLVTVFFQEKMGGFLRVIWQGPQGAKSLSDNFYEGIGMGNQRSLLISPETLQGAGTLTFQCGDTTLGIQRIKFQWLENKSSLIAPEIKDALVIAAPDAVLSAATLAGQPPLAEAAAWQGQIVRVPVTDTPERIEQGVEFSIPLDSLPATGRLVLKEAGLPWGQRLVVWINQQRAGTITPGVPDLLDDGFLGNPTMTAPYVGWRDGSMFLPVAFLKTGANAIQFAVENDAEAPTGGTPSPAPADLLPLAVKNVVLQLSYPPGTEPAVPATPAPAPSTPDAPAPSPESPSVPPPDLSIPGSVAQPVSSPDAP